MANLIQSLLGKIKKSLYDQEGFLQNGKLTLQPITKAVSSIPSTISNFSQSITPPKIETPKIRPIEALRQKISDYAYKNPSSPLVKWATQTPSEEIPYMGKTFTMPKKIFGSELPTKYVKYVGAPQAEALQKGIQSYAKIKYSALYGKPKLEDVGNIAGGIGAINPAGAVVGGGFGALMKAGENILTKKPITKDLYKGYRQGFEFQSKLGPLSEASGVILKPILSKLNPTGMQQWNTYIRLAKNTSNPQMRNAYINRLRQAIVSQLGEKAVRGAVSMGTYGATEPAKDWKERFNNIISQGLQGAAFEVGGRVVGQGTNVLYNQMPKIKLGNKKRFIKKDISSTPPLSPTTEEVGRGQVGLEPIKALNKAPEGELTLLKEEAGRHGTFDDFIDTIKRSFISQNKTPKEHQLVSQIKTLNANPETIEGQNILKNFYNQTIKEAGLKLINTSDNFIKELEEVNKNLDYKSLPEKTTPQQKNISDIKQDAFSSSYKVETDKEKIKQLFADWIGKRRSANITALKEASSINIPKDINPELIIKKMENPDFKTIPEVDNIVSILRNKYDELFKEAKKVNADIPYLKNYITHIWKETPEEVAQKYKALSKKFKFSQERIFPTYEEGIKMGLTPKYSDPRQILAEYISNLEKVKANLDFFNTLKKEGLVVEKRIPGFEPIIGTGFPSKNVKIGEDKIYEGVYYAPKEIADMVNKVFSPQSENILTSLGNVATGFQDIVMSGGIPKTPINAWTAAQMIKEFMAGRIKSPLKAFFLSLSEGLSNNYFKDNIDFIYKMERKNIPISTTFNIENLKDKGFMESLFGKNVKEAWNKFVNEPTFKRFMPILNIEFFKDVYNSALKKGLSEEEALEVAAKSFKNFYAVITSDKSLLSNNNVEAVKRILFFAPKYRETLINFWVNNIKALKNPFTQENIYNTRFLLGGLFTYLAMNKLNKINTGRNMWENPKGLEDKLLIKTNDGYIGIPFLSSIATIPRALIRETKYLMEGDMPTLTKDVLQTYSSSVIKPITDIFSNSDYFGKPIYDEEDDATTRYKKIFSYLATQYTGHPYVKEILDERNQDDPAYQRLSRAMELPLRFYAEKSINSRYYYQIRDNILKGLNNEERKSFDYINQINKSSDDPNVRVLKYRIYYKYPEVFKARQSIELQMALKTNKAIDPLYLVDYNTARKYMVYESLPEASPERKAMIKAYPELLVLFEKRSDFFKTHPYFKEEDSSMKQIGLSYPEPSDYVKRQMENKNWSDPEVKSYLDTLRTYQNQQRLELGLLPVDTYGNILGSGSNFFGKSKKIKFTKPPKIKTVKIKFKVGKIPQVKIPKRKIKFSFKNKPKKKIKFKSLSNKL